MLNFLRLGIVYKSDDVLNHRSILKIILNPILFQFGYYIGTDYNEETKLLGKIVWCKDAKLKGRNIIKDYWEHLAYAPKSYYDFVEFKRILI